ncbi:MAG TPA: endonuclease/exonuclease/phosphatase family protein [Gammaproteobacteria bacterium]|nr:endonuclease/exonuclease/phosphatase family protein [Gammaproteobacteria bacterium]
MRYATGAGLAFHWPLPGIGYIKDTAANFQRITDFVVETCPDIVGLIEVDTGSFRSRSINQADAIAEALGHACSYKTKYGAKSFSNRLPIMRKQGNAFITGSHISNERIHYFDAGVKRLILELELDDLSVFLVHLSLKYSHRHYQLRHLHALIRQTTKPLIVAGDFNTLRGDYEIELFMAATGLRSANRLAKPSYPSHAPRKQLDFILHSNDIRVTDFHIPKVPYSDHLPLVCDFEIDVGAARSPIRAVAQ